MNKICKDCGAKCCKGFWIIVKLNSDLKKYLKAHRCIILGQEQVFIPIRCKFLTEKNKCMIYNSPRKLKICKDFKCTLLGGKEPIPEYKT